MGLLPSAGPGMFWVLPRQQCVCSIQDKFLHHFPDNSFLSVFSLYSFWNSWYLHFDILSFTFHF